MSLKNALADKVAKMEALQAQADEAKRPMDDTEQKSYDALLVEAGVLDGLIKEGDQVETKTAEGKALLDGFKATAAAATDAGGAESGAADDGETKDITDAIGDKVFHLIKGAAQPVEEKSLGDQFIESKGYTTAIEKADGLPSGDQCVVSMEPGTGVETKNLVEANNTGTGPIRVVGPQFKARRLLAAMNTGMSTRRDSITTTRATFVNGADVVAEGAAKPPSDLTFADFTENVVKIAHSIEITEEALADNEYMKSLIDTVMINGVLRRVEAQAATWLAALTGVQVQAWDTDLLTTIRMGIAGVEEFSDATGLLMNNMDSARLDLLTDANGQFLGGGAYGGGATKPWDLQKFGTSAIPAGTAYLGPIEELMWVSRSPVSVRTGWVNDQFKENKLTVLGETRGMNDVLQPANVVRLATVAP